MTYQKEYKTFKRLESVSRFYPKGLNVFSGTFLSYIEKKALKQISEYIPSNELPIEKVNSYIYKFKSKNR